MRVACRRFAVVAVGGMLISACVAVALAPGAEKVRVTQNAADVAGCIAVGNIIIPDGLGPTGSENQFRNRALGLGGNAAFVTSSSFGAPMQGVAYRCASH